jgi:hypothetical protein
MAGMTIVGNASLDGWELLTSAVAHRVANHSSQTIPPISSLWKKKKHAWRADYAVHPPSANVIRARKFHKDIQWSNGRVIKSSLAARDWLVHLRDALEDGGQTINVEDAGSSLIG